MTTKSFKLSDFIRVRSRFGRSVNLERDFYSSAPVDGYIFTSTAATALHRLTESLTDTDGSRAWTLTGPYGSGKSTFALFTAKILSAAKNGEREAARSLLKAEAPALWHELFDHRRVTALGGRGFCPVLISGSREPIDQCLLRGLRQAIRYFWSDKPSQLLNEVDALIKATQSGEAVPGRSIVAVFERVAEKVCSSRNPGHGLLVVVDELGKLLDYAAAHPERSDIFVLQELAEASRRSSSHPILFITILHQSFDRYLEKLGRSRKEEWMKVQGRFEDIAFHEPIEEVLRILARAIERYGSRHSIDVLKRHGRESARKAKELKILPAWANSEEVTSLLEDCAPLHPTVSLMLGHLFRQFGQNERSLFTFLSSHEPHGFQEFLASSEWDEQCMPSLRIDNLYDYIITTIGRGLHGQASGKKWAEIDSALHRLADATEAEVKLIKTIGLMNAIGDIGSLKPSKELLRFAVTDQKTKLKDVDRALKKLESRSIIIYRRYRDAYSLWEGSDVDIEARLAEARRSLETDERLAEALTRHFKPRPLVARRHSFQTGTLRYFDVRYVDLRGFDEAVATIKKGSA